MLFDSMGRFSRQALQWRYIRDWLVKVINMAANFETKIAITGFVWMIATRQLVMEGGLSCQQPTRGRYWRYRATKGRCHDNNFCLSIYRVYIGATWRIQLNHPCAAAMQPYGKLLWPLVLYLVIFSRPAHVVQWSNHLGAMCSRAWRSQWPRIDSSLGPGASAY